MNEPPLAEDLNIPTRDLTTKDLAALWKCSERTIHRLLAKGLPCLKVGRLTRIDPVAAKKWRESETGKLNDLLNLTPSSPKAEAKGIVNSGETARSIGMVTPAATSTKKVNFNSKKGCFTGSVRDPKTGLAKTKFVPKEVTSEDEARAWLIRYEAGEHAKGAAIVKANAPAHTLATLLPLWSQYLREVKTNKQGKPLEKSTRSKWLGCIKHALEHKIGATPITTEAFTPFVVISFVSHLKRQSISSYYVIDIIAALRTMITDARKNEWISLVYNPVDDDMVKSEIPSGEPQSGKDNPIHFTLEEAKTLIGKAAPEGTEIPFTRRVATLTAICQGLRMRELQALSWGHIDLTSETMNVERQLVTQGDPMNEVAPTFKPPKKNSYRILPLHPLVKQALAALKLRMNPKASDPVFPHMQHATGYAMWQASPCQASLLRHDLGALGLETTYEKIHPYDYHATRRTFLTLLSNAGASESDVGALAGHAQKGVKKHYVKLNIERFRKTIKMLPFDGVKLEWLTAAKTKTEAA